MTIKEKLVFVIIGVLVIVLSVFIYYQLTVPEEAADAVPMVSSSVNPVQKLPELPQAAAIKPVILSNIDYQKPVRIDLSHLMRKDVEGWELNISSTKGRVVRTLRGEGTPPTEIIWDGRDDSGKLVDDAYLAKYNLDLRRGKQDEQYRDKVVKLVEAQMISPSGDFSKDLAVKFDFGLTPLDDVDDWELIIKDYRGEKLRVFAGSGMPPQVVTWRDVNPSGRSSVRVLEATFELTFRDNQGRYFKYSDSLISAGLTDTPGR